MNAVYGATFTRRGLESTPKRGKKSENPERALGATKSFDASALALVGSEYTCCLGGKIAQTAHFG